MRSVTDTHLFDLVDDPRRRFGATGVLVEDLRLAVMLLVMLMLGCGAEPPPPAPRADPPPAPAPALEPAPPALAPVPKPVPVVEPVPVTSCAIVVEGEGPKLVRAAVRARVPEGQAPDIREGRIEGEAGRTVRYDCPEPRHRSNVDFIAKLENDEVVHWTGVGVDESGEGTVVREQGAAGVPADMSPEELEILAQQRGITVEEVIAQVASTPRATKSSVVFRPNYAPWIELELQGPRTLQLVLEAKKTKALSPGSYAVSFRTREGAEWTKAEVPLELEAGKSYDVEMVSRPPFMKITVK